MLWQIVKIVIEENVKVMLWWLITLSPDATSGDGHLTLERNITEMVIYFEFDERVFIHVKSDMLAEWRISPCTRRAV